TDNEHPSTLLRPGQPLQPLLDEVCPGESNRVLETISQLILHTNLNSTESSSASFTITSYKYLNEYIVCIFEPCRSRENPNPPAEEVTVLKTLQDTIHLLTEEIITLRDKLVYLEALDQIGGVLGKFS